MDYGRRKPRPVHYIIFVLLCITLAITSHFWKTTQKSETITQALPLPATQKTTLLVPATPMTPTTPVPAPAQKPIVQTRTETLTIRHHETLAEVLHRAHLPSTLWLTLLKSERAADYLERLQENQPILITTTPTNEFVSLQYQADAATTVTEYLHDTHPFTTVDKKPITQSAAFKSSVIHHSLAQAERATGLPIALQHQLHQMLTSGDFARNIHVGDRLNVLYHEYFVGDHKEKKADVVAAEITHGDKNYRIVRFTAPNNKTGIYTANGQDTKPAFLKAPLAYNRIGSRFQYNRLDPVIHKVHPHLGVDFDAPRGTPVKAIGNGVVVFCRQVRGYGNVVMIRYNKTYKTMYAHLEKFAGHLHANQTVEKGQVVGYVGSTGWATGPHLHYSVYKNGVAVNPLTVEFPHGNPIPARYRRDFTYETNHWFNEMKLFEAQAVPTKAEEKHKKRA